MKKLIYITYNTLLLIIVLTVFASCNKRYKFPENFMALDCLEGQECIDFQNMRIKKEPILIVKAEKVTLTEAGFNITLASKTNKSILHIKRKFPQNKLMHFYDKKLFNVDAIKNDVHHYNYQAKAENKLTVCAKINGTCDHLNYKLKKENKVRQQLSLKRLKNINKNYMHVSESLEWVGLYDRLFVFNKDASKTIKTISANKISLRQVFNSKSKKFIYTSNMIKFDFGWLKRTDIAPKNIQYTRSYYVKKITRLMLEKKCIDREQLKGQNKSISNVENFLDKMIRSLVIGHKAIMKKDFNQARVSKRIKGITCPK
jgi:hypothetical protein